MIFKPRSCTIPIIGLVSVLSWAAPAGAIPVAAPSVSVPWVRISGDCYSTGTRVAAERGAKLARAEPQMRGSQRVCVIVILVPGKDGGRPRRVKVEVNDG